MNRLTSATRDLAGRLVSGEARANRATAAKTPVAFEVCERLRPAIATLMGAGGFRALLSRALAMASVEVEWLRGVQVKADGTLEEFSPLEETVDVKRPDREGVALVAHLLGLLTAFIGESLTLRLVREVWPKLPLKNLDFGNGDKNEKTN